jgi:hypothetical protein
VLRERKLRVGSYNPFLPLEEMKIGRSYGILSCEKRFRQVWKGNELNPSSREITPVAVTSRVGLHWAAVRFLWHLATLKYALGSHRAYIQIKVVNSLGIVILGIISYEK